MCNHYPIRKLYVLRDLFNGNKADPLFKAFHRIEQNPYNALNPEVIDYVYQQGWIDDWKYQFYMDTYWKRDLSAKHAPKQRKINELVVWQIKSAGCPNIFYE